MHAGVHGPSKRADIYAHMLTIYHALRTGWPACGFFLFCYLLRRGVLNIGHGQPRSYDATRIGLCEIGAYLECRGRGWEEEEKSLFKADEDWKSCITSITTVKSASSKTYTGTCFEIYYNSTR